MTIAAKTLLRASASSTANVIGPSCSPGRRASENIQIYEGTNQIQRMVMARQLLK
ncbi:hypothetical protein GCM10020001_060590 [Nonomuraea salmonea]